ncbi:hypothetical protein ACLB2K_002310 [Fragaria x ananassa]
MRSGPLIFSNKHRTAALPIRRLFVPQRLLNLQPPLESPHTRQLPLQAHSPTRLHSPNPSSLLSLPALPFSFGGGAMCKRLASERRQSGQTLSDKTRCLQKLLPWENKMDTATMLESAHRYVRFLQAQVATLQAMPIVASDCSLPVLTRGGGEDWFWGRCGPGFLVFTVV